MRSAGASAVSRCEKRGQQVRETRSTSAGNVVNKCRSALIWPMFSGVFASARSSRSPRSFPTKGRGQRAGSGARPADAARRSGHAHSSFKFSHLGTELRPGSACASERGQWGALPPTTFPGGTRRRPGPPSSPPVIIRGIAPTVLSAWRSSSREARRGPGLAEGNCEGCGDRGRAVRLHGRRHCRTADDGLRVALCLGRRRRGRCGFRLPAALRPTWIPAIQGSNATVTVRTPVGRNPGCFAA